MSKGCWVFAWKPISIAASVVAHYDYHFVQLWSDLHTACQSAVFVGGTHWRSVECSHFCWRHSVCLVEVGLTDNYLALAAWLTHWVVIVWNLVRCKSMLLLTSCAVCKDASCVVSLENLKKWFAAEAWVSARNAIRWQHVDPNNLIGYFYSSVFVCWSECMRRKSILN